MTSVRYSIGLTSLIYWIVAFSLAAAEGQSSPPREGDAPSTSLPPTVSLEFGHPQRAVLFSSRLAIGFPIYCDPNGGIMFTANSFSQASPAVSSLLYALKPGGNIGYVTFDPNMSGLQNIIPTSHFSASSSRVAWIVNAVTPEEKIKDQSHDPHPFLLIFDVKGTFLRATVLDPHMTVGGLGLFDSGEVFLAGSDLAQNRRRWLLMDEDGSYQRGLSPDTPNLSQPPNGKALTGMTGMTQIVRRGQNLMLLQVNTTNPIIEINKNGIVRSTNLHLPEGEDVGEFIVSNGRTWKVILGHTNDKGDNGSPAGTFMMDKIGEFDPDTGILLRYLSPGRDRYPSSIACEEDGVFYGLRTDPKDGNLLIEKGAAAK